MGETQTSFERFQFADWTAEVSSAELVSKDETIRLEPRQMAVLALLASRPGQVFSRQRLLDEVWKGEYVTDDAVWRCIHGLRKTLGDDSERPRFIETLPRLGYRFIAEVRPSARGDLSNMTPVANPEVEPKAVAAIAATTATTAENAAEPSRAASESVGPAAAATLPQDVEVPPRRRLALWAPLGGLGVVALLSLGWLLRERAATSSVNEVATSTRTAAAATTATGNAESPPATEVERILADAWEFHRRPEPVDQERAVELFLRAVELEPENPAALVGLGNGYLSRGQSVDRDPRWLREADALANRALALAPERADVRRLLAGVAYSRGFHRVALERIEEAERLAPHAPGLYEQFGAIYLELGELDRALLSQLKRRERPLPMLVANQAEALAAVGARKEAEALLVRTLERTPVMPGLAALLARLRVADGRRSEARELLDRLLRSNPFAAQAVVERASLALMEGDVDSAHRHAETLRKLPPARAFTRELVIAASFRAQGENGQADRSIQGVRATAMRLLENGHEGFEPRMALAAVACARGDVDEAIRWMTEAQDRGFMRHWSVQVDPLFACLTPDPRFAALVEESEKRAELARRRLDRAEPRWRELASRAD